MPAVRDIPSIEPTLPGLRLSRLLARAGSKPSRRFSTRAAATPAMRGTRCFDNLKERRRSICPSVADRTIFAGNATIEGWRASRCDQSIPGHHFAECRAWRSSLHVDLRNVISPSPYCREPSRMMALRVPLWRASRTPRPPMWWPQDPPAHLRTMVITTGTLGIAFSGIRHGSSDLSRHRSSFPFRHQAGSAGYLSEQDCGGARGLCCS